MSDEKNPTFGEQEELEEVQNETSLGSDEASEDVEVTASEEEEVPAVEELVDEEEEEEEEEEIELDLGYDPNSAHDDFNWNITNKGGIAYTPDEAKSYLEQYDATMNAVLENEIVKGIVTSINDGDVVLDINYKSDGLLPLSEFRDLSDLKVGDPVEVYVEHQEDVRGQLVLSRRKAKLLRAWENIVDSYENGTVIKGTVISKTKGGLIADCGGLETFLPGSQIDIKPIIDYDAYVGKTM
ncbi:MAG: S1 RNA-binding domain-containing protein, partial [Haliscomenobacter sp.]